MSIANLYGKTSFNIDAVDTSLVTKTYIPGGVMLSSQLFAPVSGINAADRIKLFYTKVGNLVSISCRVFIAANGDVIDYFTGTAAVGEFSSANLGPDITAQLNNDLLVKDANVVGASIENPLRIPGLFVNGTNGSNTVAYLDQNLIRIWATAAANSVLTAGNEYYCGGISFVSQNAAIVV